MNDNSNRAHPELLITISLAILTVVVFSRVGGNGFIDFDDNQYVLKNPYVRAGLTWNGIQWAFSSTYMANWHPLTWISHMLDVQLFGLNPMGHHLVNLLVHTANSVLLFRILMCMTAGFWQSAFVATLFAIHPLHVESVAWVAERKDVLSMLFFLLTLQAYHHYVKHPGAGRMSIALLFFALGLMAKPMLVSLPLVLILLDYWPLGRFMPAAGEKVGWNRAVGLIWEKIPFFALTLASCIVTFVAQKSGGAVVTLVNAPFFYRLANSFTAYATYILKAFWPVDLAIFYPLPAAMSLWAVAGSILLLCVVSVFAFWSRRRFPFIPVGWLWYLVTLVPVIGLVQVGAQSHADRYTYIPLIGLFIIIAWGAEEIGKKIRGFDKAAACVAAAVIISLSTMTWVQIGHWKNSLELFYHTLRVTTDNAKIETLVGKVLCDKGNYDGAIAHYRQALKSSPDYYMAHNDLGIALATKGERAEAVGHFREAVRLKPDQIDYRINLGIALTELGNLDEALSTYAEAQAMDPLNREIAHKIQQLSVQRRNR